MSTTPEAVSLKGPRELYFDWERAHWAAQDIDLTRDGADWAGLDAGERDLLYWVLSSLMVAEERISTQFCGLVLAQDDEEEGSFLSTQLVDEVRHMQFYARFQDEVIAEPAAIAAHVARLDVRSARRSARSSTRRSSTPTSGFASTRETARRRWTS
jgi:ribonucleotide reductase beta subunit family protein with ferritin-like domain